MEIKLLRNADIEFIESFWNSLSENDISFFHPHTFNHESACKICEYVGKDEYYAIWDMSKIAGYGMLRGMDDGYAVPSLGLCIGNKYRRTGLSKLFINFLEISAKLKGCGYIRLSVMLENTYAIKLYSSLGYCLTQSEDSYIGIKKL